MQAFVLAMILLVTLASYAGDMGAPRVLGYTPEIASVLAIVYVVFEGTRHRFQRIAGKYWLAFGAIGLVAIAGVFVNDVATAPLLNGMRYYLRALPFFFVPAIANFKEQQLRQQLRLLLLLGLLQLPVSGLQRWVVFSHGRFSGDDVIGTLDDSGTMSIFLICAGLVLTGMYLRQHIGLKKYLPLLFLLLFPTTIDETKVTVIYIPLGMFITALVGAERGRRMRVAGGALALIVAFGAVFVPVYNEMEIHSPYKDERDIVSFFTDQKRVDQYLVTKANGIGTKQDVGRGNAIAVPFAYLSQDPIRFALGLGLGNTSPSSLGKQYEGRYHELFDSYLQTSFSYFFLELGALGCVCLTALYWLIFKDALAVAADSGWVGGLAIGWAGATVLMFVSLTYSAIHMFDSLSYLYWYLSGVIAAKRVDMLTEAGIVPAAIVPTRLAGGHVR